MDSVWEKEICLPEFPQLEGDLRADVLVIGGGLAGLLVAWKLTRAGVDCALIEENRVMHGVSGRTTAKLTSQHGPVYAKLLRTFGPEVTRRYWQANQDALDAYRELAAEAEVDFEEQTAWLYQRDGKDKLEAERIAYEALRIPHLWKDRLLLPFPVSGGLGFSGQAQFHPLKLAAHISGGLKIYENTKAMAFLGNRVQTQKGTVTAEKIIVATHFPLLNKHGAFFLKLYQQRSYVIALENADKVEGMYLDCRENGLSFRSAGPWLLIGGGGHRTGKRGAGWALPEGAAAKYYPKAPVAARWATQDCMTLDGMPYIGLYSKATPNLYVATGFQKWGMTTSMTAATVLCNLVRDREDPYEGIFSPQRSMLHKQLLYNGLEFTVNLLRPTMPRCPHLGCALRWNRAEHSWDCPCHGSRFSSEGRLLNNPATDGLKRPPSKH